jgi:hypothetical protein
MATDNSALWEKFDKTVDVDALAADVLEAAENGGEYREVPHGQYEVEVTKLELGESKKNDPMVRIWFKVLEGDYKGSYIFMNQVVTQGFQIHIINEVLRKITEHVTPTIEITFKSYSQYDSLIMEIFEAIDGKFEFALDYAENNKGYNTFEITEVYALV